MTAQTATTSPGWTRHRDALVRALRAFLPTEALLTVPETLRPYECDGLSAYRRVPGLWGGARRWLRTEASAEDIHRVAKAAGDHALPYRAHLAEAPMAKALQSLHLSLRRSLRSCRDSEPGRTERIEQTSCRVTAVPIEIAALVYGGTTTFPDCITLCHPSATQGSQRTRLIYEVTDRVNGINAMVNRYSY